MTDIPPSTTESETEELKRLRRWIGAAVDKEFSLSRKLVEEQHLLMSLLTSVEAHAIDLSKFLLETIKMHQDILQQLKNKSVLQREIYLKTLKAKPTKRTERGRR